MPVVLCPAPCPPITRGIVQFSAPEFVGLWPQFAGLPNPAMAQQFVFATLLLKNSCASAVQDANERLQLLYMLTAHLCILNVGTDDGNGDATPAQGMVGRIANATEGSVTVAAEYSSEVTQSEAFYIQTQPGALFWQATASYRTMHYVGAPSVGPNGPGFPWLGDGFFGVE